MARGTLAQVVGLRAPPRAKRRWASEHGALSPLGPGRLPNGIVLRGVPSSYSPTPDLCRQVWRKPRGREQAGLLLLDVCAFPFFSKRPVIGGSPLKQTSNNEPVRENADQSCHPRHTPSPQQEMWLRAGGAPWRAEGGWRLEASDERGASRTSSAPELLGPGLQVREAENSLLGTPPG